jgi:hypothetical protein
VKRQPGISVRHRDLRADVVPRQLHTSHGGLTRSISHADDQQRSWALQLAGVAATGPRTGGRQS